MASCGRANNQSWHPKTDGTINRGVQRSIALSIVASCDQAYDQSWHRTIWNRRLEVLNMTIDLATTDFALAIAHDLRDQLYVLSTICPRFQHFSVAGSSRITIARSSKSRHFKPLQVLDNLEIYSFIGVHKT